MELRNQFFIKKRKKRGTISQINVTPFVDVMLVLLIVFMITAPLLTVGVSVEDTTLGTTVANLGFEETVFPNPVFLNDTLSFETEVIHSRMSTSRPETGIVTFEHRAFKQSGELVCRCRRNALMHCIPSENKLDND